MFVAMQAFLLKKILSMLSQMNKGCCVLYISSIVNSAMSQPMQGMVDPPTTCTLLSHGIKAAGLIPIWLRCCVPARHMVAPLSGKMSMVALGRLREFGFPRVILAAICSSEPALHADTVSEFPDDIRRARAISENVRTESDVCLQTGAKWLSFPQSWQVSPHAGHFVERSLDPGAPCA